MATLRSSARVIVSRWLRPQGPTRKTLGQSSTILGCRRNSSSGAGNSSDADDPFRDPSRFVSGLTKEQVESNPAIADFLKSNFAAGGDNNDNTEGVSIPLEVLKEYGYDESDFDSIDEGKQYGEPRIDNGLGSPEQQALNIRKLSTFLRQEQGTRACDALRDEFIIPGILYGSDPTQGISSKDKSTRFLVETPWPELQRELARYHRHLESRVYDLTIYEDHTDTEGAVHRVVPRDVQHHPVRGMIYCANFLRYHAGRPLKIPIVYINQEESPALKRDGYIIPVNKYVECIVEEGVPIPKALELECTGLQLKEVIRLDRLIFPDGVRPSRRVNPETFVIGPVAGGRGGAQAGTDDDAKEAA